MLYLHLSDQTRRRKQTAEKMMSVIYSWGADFSIVVMHYGVLLLC